MNQDKNKPNLKTFFIKLIAITFSIIIIINVAYNLIFADKFNKLGKFLDISSKENIEQIKVPAGKYKSDRDWKIPLTPQAIKILKSMPTRKGRVFSTIDGNEIHDKYLSAMPDALGFDAVAHGFRSTFRTWGQEQQRFTEEVLGLCMKHTKC